MENLKRGLREPILHTPELNCGKQISMHGNRPLISVRCEQRLVDHLTLLMSHVRRDVRTLTVLYD